MKLYRLHIVLLLSLGQLTGYGQAIFDSTKVAQIVIQPETLINTPNSEYSPVYYGDKVGYVYSSSKGRQLDRKINEPFYDLGYADVDTTGRLALSASFSKEINSPLHEGPFVIYGDEILFTRVVDTRRRGRKRYTQSIYRADLDGDNVRPLNFSTKDVKVCHPAIDSKGETLIFAGDLNQSGHMDLYQASRVGTSWGPPQLLAGQINTESHEVFPTMVNDSTLLFSSDREGGLGGYDFYISRYKDGFWSQPQNLQTPLNSISDDLGLIINDNGTEGYFASNRPGGEGKDDIYHWQAADNIFTPAVILHEAQFSILDKLSFEPIQKAIATITAVKLPMGSNVEDINAQLQTGNPAQLVQQLKLESTEPYTIEMSNGKFLAEVEEKTSYLIEIKAPEYVNYTLLYDYTSYGKELDIVMEPKAKPAPPKKVVVYTPPPPPPVVKEEKVVIPTEVGEKAVFTNIHFKVNQVELLPEAKVELDQLVQQLKERPSMRIKLSSHTDSKGEKSYNQLLSEERAYVTKNYLVSKGIRGSRIVAKGYGEQYIRNHCVNGVECTKEEHRYNRRIEIEVLRK